MIIKEDEYKIIDFDLLEILVDKKNALEKEYNNDLCRYKWNSYTSINFANNELQASIYEHLLEIHDLYTLEYKKVCRAIKEVKDILGIKPIDRRELDIESAKEFPITELLRIHNIEVNKRQFKCFLHNDNTASGRIYEKTNSWYVFCCGKGGNPIDFLTVQGVSFTGAVKQLT